MKLTIGNSMCHFEGLPLNHLRGLRKELSYTVNIGRRIRTKSGKFIPLMQVHHLMDKHGSFPSGLLYLVDKYIDSNKLNAQRNDTRVLPKQTFTRTSMFIKDLPFKPYFEQEQIAIAAAYHHRGIVAAVTAFGKSFTTALILDRLKVKSLIVVPSLALKTQLTETLQEFFGKDMVGPLVRGKCKFYVTVENVDALDPDKKPEGVDLLIIDEFHHAAAATYRKLNQKAWTDIYYRIGLTATPHRSNENERLLLETVLSKVIYRVSYQDAVKAGYVVPVEAYYYELAKKGMVKTGGQFAKVYNELIVNNEERNTLITNLLVNLIEAKKSTLVLVKQIQHGEILQDLLLKAGYDVPFAQGINGEENKPLIRAFNENDPPILIGTSGVLGEGVDSKPAEYVILAGGGKAKNQFMQQVGRGLRKYPDKESAKIIMFKDCNHKWFKAHHAECVKILAEEYGIAPTLLTI